MKRFKVNTPLYFIFPVFIASIITSYIFIIFKNSYTAVNIVNIAVDAITLLIYLFKFCTEIKMDSEGINFYTIFRKKRVLNNDVLKVAHSSFLTRVSFKGGAFYILTTQRGKDVLEGMFKDIKK